MRYYRESGDVYEQVAALSQPDVRRDPRVLPGAGSNWRWRRTSRSRTRRRCSCCPRSGSGSAPSSGGTYRVVRMFGPARAKELILLGRTLAAHEALAAGLVTEVCEEGAAALRRAVELAATVAEAPPVAVAVAKQAIDAMTGSSRGADLLIERLAYGMLAQTQDAIDAADRFTSKREDGEPDTDP